MQPNSKQVEQIVESYMEIPSKGRLIKIASGYRPGSKYTKEVRIVAVYRIYGNLYELMFRACGSPK